MLIYFVGCVNLNKNEGKLQFHYNVPFLKFFLAFKLFIDYVISLEEKCGKKRTAHFRKAMCILAKYSKRYT